MSTNCFSAGLLLSSCCAVGLSAGADVALSADEELGAIARRLDDWCVGAVVGLGMGAGVVGANDGTCSDDEGVGGVVGGGVGEGVGGIVGGGYSAATEEAGHDVGAGVGAAVHGAAIRSTAIVMMGSIVLVGARGVPEASSRASR